MPQTDKHGVFAVLKSSQKIDHTMIRGGLLNLKFHPVTLRGEAGSEKLLNLIRTYFQKNGFHLQFNVVDRKTLLDAKAHPEKYRDLIVRVAGFSALFVELSEGIQNEIIARTEHFLNGEGEIFSPKEQHSNKEAYVCNIQDFTVQDGPGIRSTIFMQGCPLKCRWCCNPETQSFTPVYLVNRKLCDGCKACSTLGAKFNDKSKYPDLSQPSKIPELNDENVCPQGALKVSSGKTTATALFNKIKKNSDFYRASNGGITFSGGEPLMHAPFIHEFMTLSKGHGIKLGIETAGHWKLTSTISDILEGCNFIYYDIKCVSDDLHKKVTGVSNNKILNNLKVIAAEHKSKIIISVPVIPGVNTDPTEFEKIFSLVKELGISRIRLLPFHPMGASKYEQMGITYEYSVETKVEKETLEKMIQAAKKLQLTCFAE